MIQAWQVAGTQSAADLGTQAAAAEGFGLPIAETLAAGTPVVGSDHPVMRQVIGPGGWLADAEDLWATGHEAWWRMPTPGVAAAKSTRPPTRVSAAGAGQRESGAGVSDPQGRGAAACGRITSAWTWSGTGTGAGSQATREHFGMD